MSFASSIIRLATATTLGLSLAAGFVGQVCSADSARSSDAAIDDHVRAAMDASGIPGLAFGIVRDGEIVHVGAFGMAGGEVGPMTSDTPVIIGSVGKSFTALAIRQLIEAGRIDEDAPVTRYLPWFRLGGPTGATELVTIRSLLEHTSGISTADGQDPRLYVPGLSPQEAVGGLAGVRADRPAGSYEYSNLNYVVLGIIVEAVSGEPYGAYLDEHVFEPLGMQSTFAGDDAAVVARLQAGHRYLFGIPVPFDEPYPTAMVAAGYQVSTAQDMARYVAALSNHGRGAGVDLLASASPSSSAERDFGTDWQPVAPERAQDATGQSGSTLTSNADILVVPGAHLGVVVVANANPTQLMNLPAGAANIALDVLRLELGQGLAAPVPTVRTVYLGVDLLLAVLVVLLVVHAVRARSWQARLARSTHRRLSLTRTVLADLVLPMVVLVGVPLAIGSTGSTPAGDVLAGWRFAFWTLPELAGVLVALACGALAIGAWKLAVLLRGSALGELGAGA